MRSPSKRTSPDDLATRPIMALSVVDFPAPLRPNSATTCPAPAWKLTSYSTRARPYPADSPRTSSVAKVDLAQAGIGADQVRRALGDHLAEMQRDDALREAEDDVHVVLGEQHGNILAARKLRGECHQRAALLGRHPGGRLVHQQQARALRQRHPELHP